MNISNRIRKMINEDNKVEKKYLIENIIKRVSQKLITERKTDELSLYISRKIINQFKKKEDFEVEGLYFQRGDEEASFDLICKFIEDEDFNHPFSVSAGADFDLLDIEITYRPQDFPKRMNDLVAEIKETVEHELEHIEQKNFEDLAVPKEDKKDDNLGYLTSLEEVPAYVRGLIKRSKTKRISLSDAMDEWFDENINKFDNPKRDWVKVKSIWMDYANKIRSKGQIKKFK
jgi:hypothetical protein